MWRSACRDEKFNCIAPRNKPVLFEFKPILKKVTFCQPSWHGAGSCVSQARKEQHCPERFATNFAGNTGYMVRENYHKVLFPKQFTVGVLNATLDLAALVLVGVVGFLGSEVVLSPVVSHCLRLSPFIRGVGVGWCGRLLGLWSGLVSRCLWLSPFMWGVGVGWCGRISSKNLQKSKSQVSI